MWNQKPVLGTKICFDALINDQIDLYPEYSGTGLLATWDATKNCCWFENQRAGFYICKGAVR